MGDTVETFRLKQDVEGAEKLAWAEELLASIKERSDELAASALAGREADLKLAPAVDLLRQRMAELNEELAVAANSFAHGINSIQEYKDRIAPIQAELATTRSAYTALGGSIEGVTHAARGSGRVFQEATILLNELAMGRVRGLTATINRLGLALGGPAGLASMIGMATLAGVELYRHWDEIKKLWEGLKIPKVTGDLKDMQEALKLVNKEMEEAREHRFDSLDAYQVYKDLTLAQLDLEKAITAEKKKQKEIDDLLRLRPLSETEEAAAKAKVMKSRLGGDQAFLIEAAQKELERSAEFKTRQSELDRREQQAQKTIDENRKKLASIDAELSPEEKVWVRDAIRLAESDMAKAREQRAQNSRVISDRAKSLVAEAYKGDSGAFSDVQRAAQAHPEVVSDQIRKELRRATPTGRQEMRDAEAEVERALNEDIEALKEDQKAAKETADAIGARRKAVAAHAAHLMAAGWDDKAAALRQAETIYDAKKAAETSESVDVISQYARLVEEEKAKTDAIRNDPKKTADVQREINRLQERYVRDGWAEVEALEEARKEQEARQAGNAALLGRLEAAAAEKTRQMRAAPRDAARAETSMEARFTALVGQNWDTMAAQQEAVMEGQARMNGMIERYAILARNARMLSDQARRMHRVVQMVDRQMSLLNFGSP